MRKGMQREAAPRERVDFLTGGSGELQVGFGAHDAEVFQVQKEPVLDIGGF